MLGPIREAGSVATVRQGAGRARLTYDMLRDRAVHIPQSSVLTSVLSMMDTFAAFVTDAICYILV